MRHPVLERDPFSFHGRGRGRHFGHQHFGREFSRGRDFGFPYLPDFSFDRRRMRHHRGDPFVLPTWDAPPPVPRADPFVQPTWNMRPPPSPMVNDPRFGYAGDKPCDRREPGSDSSSDSNSSSDDEVRTLEDGPTDRPKFSPGSMMKRHYIKKSRGSKNKLHGRDVRKIRKAIRRRMDFGKDFEVLLDITGFRRENFKIKVENNKLVVEGKHDEHPVEFVPMERHFVWKIPLPEGIGMHDIKCRYMEGGILHIVGKKPEQSTSNQGGGQEENVIQIDE